MRIALALTFLLLPSLLPPAQAQTPTEASNRRSDVFFGAAFDGGNPSTAGTTSSSASTGITGGVDSTLRGPLGVDGQIGFSSSSNGVHTVTLVDYLAGPRVSAAASRRVAPFADFLLGVQTLHNSKNDHAEYYTNGAGLAVAGDVGADIRLIRRFSLRGQAGFVFSNFTTFSGGPVGNNRWRAGVSLVYRF